MKKKYNHTKRKAVLVLEDGTVFTGFSFGAKGVRYGEVVFNTSMAGYQEILTDPSYKGQIVTMTYPLIGNYGVNTEDIESRKPFVEGFVVREDSYIASNWRSGESLSGYLKENNIIAIEGVDTRALTRHIRLQGAMKAVISTTDSDIKTLISKVIKSPGLIGRDLVKDVSCQDTHVWSKSSDSNFFLSGAPAPKGKKKSTVKKYKVVALDCGVKYNILRRLVDVGCQVVVMPAVTKAEKILKKKPHGILLSNGPGDPAGVPYVIETVRNLLGKVPLFGICLGHQMLGLALGGKTYKLKFGHHGANHPVKDLNTGRVLITVQNHGFCVDEKSLDKNDIEITHINLNDNTLEGIKHKRFPAFSVQFHPEASAGPHDAGYLFNEFVKMMGR